MSFAGAIATCSILLLLRVPFAQGQSSKVTSEGFVLEQILSKNGCGAFASLVASTAAAGEAFHENFSSGAGLTIFRPDDKAVAAFGRGTFSNLTAGDQVALLLYHGVAKRFESEEELGRVRYGMSTLASRGRDPVHRVITLLYLYVDGGAVILSSVSPLPKSWNESRVIKQVVENDRLVVYLIDSVLVPGDPTTLYVVLAFLCFLFGLLVLVVVVIPVVRRLRRSCQDRATAYVSAARVTPVLHMGE